MPTGNLPKEGKDLYEKVYQQALKGSCKGDEECAARTAWSAVKGAGWKKDKEGQWVKEKSLLAEFSLVITKASYDKASGEMRWSAVASDTDYDSYNERMSLELFSDFVKRIDSKESPPKDFCSSAWCGGMPYVSVSHYSDLNGMGIAGDVQKVYIDGNRLKASGVFSDTSIGRACFRAVCDDLYNKEKSQTDPVRISIAFLDWGHAHRDMRFERKSFSDSCPMCRSGMGEKTYLKGQLIHLALTRVPVNKRTEIEPDMEVIKAMAITRKEDAASIIGEDEANQLEQAELMVGKSEALVVKSEDVSIETTEQAIIEEVAQPEVAVVEMETKSEITLEALVSRLEAIEKRLGEKWILPVNEPLSDNEKQPNLLYATKETEDEEDEEDKKKKMKAHVLDPQLESIKAAFDHAVSMNVSTEEKLASLNEPLTAFVQTIRSNIVPAVIEQPVKQNDTVSRSEVTQAIRDAVQPLVEQMSLIASQLSAKSGVSASTSVPPRRSIAPTLVQQSQAQHKPGSIAELAWKSTAY